MSDKSSGRQPQGRQSPANPANASGHKKPSLESLYKSLEQTLLAVQPFEVAFHSAQKQVEKSASLLVGAREALSKLNHLKYDYETKVKPIGPT